MNAMNLNAINQRPGGIWPASTFGAALVALTPVYGSAVLWILWWAL